MSTHLLSVAALILLGACVASSQQPFDPHRDAQKDLIAAEMQARQQHKRILLDFGANWCAPCVSLDKEFITNNRLEQLLNAGYVLVHVAIEMHADSEATQALRKRYPPFALVPHLLVVDSKGKLLHDQNIALLLKDMPQMIWDDKLIASFLSTWSERNISKARATPPQSAAQPPAPHSPGLPEN